MNENKSDTEKSEALKEVLYEHVGMKAVNAYGTKDNPLFLSLDVAYWVGVAQTCIATKINQIENKKWRTVDAFHGMHQDWVLDENSTIELMTLIQASKPEVSVFKAAFIVMMNEWRNKNDLVTNSPDSSKGMQIFQNEQFGNIRVVEKSGDFWFVAADVCNAFGVANSRNVTLRLDADEKGVCVVDTLGGKQNLTIVNEAGLYHMLFTMEPRNARGVENDVVDKRVESLGKFKRWITHDVIPAIRKTGGYIANDDMFIDHYIPNADAATKEFVKMSLATVKKQDKLIAEQRVEIAEQSIVIAGMESKAMVYDALSGIDGLMSLTDTAKNIGIPVSELVDYCLEHKHMYRDKPTGGETKGKLHPYSSAVQRGLMSYRDRYCKRTDLSYGQTFVTFKGREFFVKALGDKSKCRS